MALVMTVSRRSVSWRANSSAVLPLPIAMVVLVLRRAPRPRGRCSAWPPEPGRCARTGEPRGRQRRPAVGPDQPPLAGETLEVPADRGRRHAEPVSQLGDAHRPSVRRCSTRRTRRSTSRMRVRMRARCSLCQVDLRDLRTSCRHRAQFLHFVDARRLPFGRWPTSSALDAASTPAAPLAARSRCSRSTTGRTCARSCGPRIPAAVSYAEMAEFKRAVVRGLADVATGVLLDPEIGVGPAIEDGSLPGPRRPDRRGRGHRLRGCRPAHG